MTDDDRKQFETIALLRAYAAEIMKYDPMDLRPSSAKYLLYTVSKMHNIKDSLNIRS